MMREFREKTESIAAVDENLRDGERERVFKNCSIVLGSAENNCSTCVLCGLYQTRGILLLLLLHGQCPEKLINSLASWFSLVRKLV